MKAAYMLAPLLFASCSNLTAHLHPDQSISISYRDFLWSDDYWISPTAPGVVTPASKLKVSYRDNAKLRQREPVDCEGFVDRTKDGVAHIQFAIRRHYRGANWRTLSYNGTHRLIVDPAPPKP